MTIAIIAATALLVSYLLTSNFVSTMIASVFAAAMCVAALALGNRGKEMKHSLIVFVALAALVGLFNQVSIRIAFSKAERLAEACEQYKAKVGSYPKELAEVAPLRDTRAKYTMFWCGFHYVNDQIYFVMDPTMPAPAYDLVAKKWTAISLFRDVKKQGV